MKSGPLASMFGIQSRTALMQPRISPKPLNTPSQLTLEGDTMLIVKAKIKDVAGDYSVAADFADKLNAVVTDLIKKACERAKENGRKTVMGRDI